jgi:hypothetical protein
MAIALLELYFLLKPKRTVILTKTCIMLKLRPCYSYPRPNDSGYIAPPGRCRPRAYCSGLLCPCNTGVPAVRS